MTDYDIIIIGGGPAGYSAAIRAGRLGLKAVLIEKDAVGGTCLNRGCIPTKYLISAVSTLKKAKENPFIENKTGLKLNFQALMMSKDILTKKLAKNVESLVQGAGVEVIKGEGRAVGGGAVEVSGQKAALKGRNVIIATGSKPAEIPIAKIDEDKILSSTGMLGLNKLPDSLGIIGGGAIGCEFAYIMAVLGVKVTLIEMLPQLLPYEDKIVARTLDNALKKIGVEIMTGAKLEEVKVSGGGVTCSLGTGKEKSFEKILVSVGRKASIGNVCEGLRENEFIKAGGDFKTVISGVYAVGDVNGASMFAHSAIAQGIAVVEGIAGLKANYNKNLIPRCVYTQPEVASVGLNEEDAAKNGIEIKTARFPYAALGKSHALNSSEGFFKIVADAKNMKILGVQIIGEEATDLIGEAVALINKGASVEELSRMVHPHPTLSEGFWEIANQLLEKPLHINPRH